MEIECKAIWQLFLYLGGLEKPYIRAKCEGDDTDFLYRVNDVNLNIGKTEKHELDLGDIGTIMVPDQKIEKVILELERKCFDKLIKRSFEIYVNAAMNPKRTMEEILERNEVTIPSEAELKKVTFDRGIPVSYVEKTPVHLDDGRRYAWRSLKYNVWEFQNYLDQKGISYVYDKDGGVSRYTMELEEPSCPGGSVTVSVKIRKDSAEIRARYSDVCSGTLKNANKEDLLWLLSFINEKVFLKQSGMSKDARDPQMFYTPRFYVSGGETPNVEAATMISYWHWEKNLVTENYVTGYCPKLLGLLAPYVFGVIEGKMSLKEAEERIEKEILSGSLEC